MIQNSGSLVSNPAIFAKDNPFASHRVEAIAYRFAHGNWDENLAQLRSMNWRGAIVGNHGSGKTTLMLELRARLEEAIVEPVSTYYCFVSRDVQDHPHELEQLLKAASQGSVLLVDGVERFGWLQRWRLLHHDPRRTRLILTAHRPMGLPVWVYCRTDWELMRVVLEMLIEAPDESMVQETKRLFHLHHGNIREVLRSLYDRCAEGGMGSPFRRVGGSDANASEGVLLSPNPQADSR